MAIIHPKAVVEEGAKLAEDVRVGPFAYIGPDVNLGPGCVVHHHASIEGHTTAGKNNEFFPNCVIGTIPQDLKYRGGQCTLSIGNDNRFRECATVHIGTEVGGGVTRIGDENLIMVAAHVAHDRIVGNQCILANAVLLAGHVVLEDYVTISGAAAVAHFVTVGQHAFIGGMSAVQRDAPPFMTMNGHPAMVRGINRNGLKRRGFSDSQLEALRTAYRFLFSDTTPLVTQVPELQRLYPDHAEIGQLLAFIRNSNSGKFGRYREALRGRPPGEEEEGAEGNGR